MESQQRLTRRRKSVRIAARNASETLSWLFTASLLSMIRSADALLLRHHSRRVRVRKYKIKRGRIHYGNKWISIEKFQLVQVFFSSSGFSFFIFPPLLVHVLSFVILSVFGFYLI